MGFGRSPQLMVIDLDDASPCSVASPPSPARRCSRRGEIVWLRGPNGAGKTTLLRLCAGLVPLTRGSGTVLGCDLATERERLRPHGRRCSATATVCTSTSPWPRTSPSGAQLVGAIDDRARPPRSSASASPDASPTVPVRRLSAGQQRRTALACLVVRRAELWLLDEPHAGLDAAGRDDLDAIVRQAAASGATRARRQPRVGSRRPLASRVVDVVGGVLSAPRPDGAAVTWRRLGVARRPPRPARRVAQPRRAQPGAAVRRRRDGDVRLRHRRHVVDATHLSRADRAGDDVLAAHCSFSGRSPSRPRTAPSTPCASPGCRPSALFWGKTAALAVAARRARGRAVRARRAAVRQPRSARRRSPAARSCG